MCMCRLCIGFFFVCQIASYVGTDKKLHAPRFKNLNPWLLSMAFYKIRIYVSRSGFWLFVSIFDLIIILLVVISDFFNAFFTAFFASGVCFAVCTGSSFAVGDGNGSRGFRGFSWRFLVTRTLRICLAFFGRLISVAFTLKIFFKNYDLIIILIIV